MSNTVEVLAEAFRDVGTPFIVGHPGGDTVHLMDAARERDMRYILMKQEVAGAMLAATWGEITGSPGLCTSTRGPGATNMVNGVAYAWLDRAPLIALTDQYPTDIYETRLRQTIDHQKIFSQSLNGILLCRRTRRVCKFVTRSRLPHQGRLALCILIFHHQKLPNKHSL